MKSKKTALSCQVKSEEGFTQKKRQTSSLLLGGQNRFNLLSRYIAVLHYRMTGSSSDDLCLLFCISPYFMFKAYMPAGCQLE